MLLRILALTLLPGVVSASAFHCGDNVHGFKEIPFCKKEMYFKCGSKKTRFSAVLNLETLGATDSYHGVIFPKKKNPRVILNTGRLGFQAKLWVTDNDGEKYQTQTGDDFVFEAHTKIKILQYSADSNRFEDTKKFIKKGTLISSPAEAGTWIPQSLRRHIKAERRHSTHTHKKGRIFRVGPGIDKYGDYHNFFTFYAEPKRNKFKLFWAVGTKRSKIKVHELSCRKAKLK